MPLISQETPTPFCYSGPFSHITNFQIFQSKLKTVQLFCNWMHTHRPHLSNEGPMVMWIFMNNTRKAVPLPIGSPSKGSLLWFRFLNCRYIAAVADGLMNPPPPYLRCLTSTPLCGISQKSNFLAWSSRSSRKFLPDDLMLQSHQSCPARVPMDQACTSPLCPWILAGKKTEVSILSPGIFLAQGLWTCISSVSCIAGRFLTGKPYNLRCCV